ncbi:type VI secretion system protein TssA [Methyloprofundus sp.]|uniref:type VI secretion system protein TssA n=1 Tax=Methyloprofundus sp. TaxID=2020875 RepID=UPI003D11D119
MVELNLQHLQNDISAESPCGENLEEDEVFLKLEDVSRFVEERQMGDSILPAEEPDWKIVRSLALELLERTRDIQVAIHLTCALLRTDSFDGLNQGLALLNGWLEKNWDTVYPIQDPEDDYPVLRVNTLSSLNDYTLIIGPINHLPLTKSVLGNFSWREIELAQGKVSPVGNESPPELSAIEAAFNEMDIKSLKVNADAVKRSLDLVKGMISLLVEKVGDVNVPDLSTLTSLLQGINLFVTEKLEQRQRHELVPEDLNADSALSNTDDSAAVVQKPIKQAGIHDRNDVVRAIDEICRYFDRYEPSSPVPFLLLRAKKLLSMNFMEILRDMTPDSVNQAENICGVHDDDDNKS